MVDMFGNGPRNSFNSVFNRCRYVTPCESDMFDEHGTPIGYFVDENGNRIPQDGFYDWGVTNGDVIDATFEEVL